MRLRPPRHRSRTRLRPHPDGRGQRWTEKRAMIMPGIAKLRSGYKAVRQVLADPRRKPVARMLREAASVAVHTREYPKKYLLAYAYHAGAGHHLSYLGLEETFAFQRWLARREYAHVLDEKLLFHRHFSATS